MLRKKDIAKAAINNLSVFSIFLLLRKACLSTSTNLDICCLLYCLHFYDVSSIFKALKLLDLLEFL